MKNLMNSISYYRGYSNTYPLYDGLGEAFDDLHNGLIESEKIFLGEK